jgi:hypothetical protein
MDPLIAVTLDRSPRVYSGGDTMRIEYQFDALPKEDISAVEISVLWLTEGKGEPDMGVHYFRRMTPDDADLADLRPLQRVDVVLPASPLSYDGVILKIRWHVRVRLFLTRGREYFEEIAFQLGRVPAAVPIGNGEVPAGEAAATELDLEHDE